MIGKKGEGRGSGNRRKERGRCEEREKRWRGEREGGKKRGGALKIWEPNYIPMQVYLH